MRGDRQDQSEVDRFVVDRIDSVPHLEALLLLWRARSETWSAEKLAEQLFVKPDGAKKLLQDLARDGLLDIDVDLEEYRYRSELETDRLIGSLNETYRRELIRVSTMIHSKPPAAVREFARAFRLKKEE